MLGNVASVATLVLFIIYFVGRFITVLNERSVCYDIISYVQGDVCNNFDIICTLDVEKDDTSNNITTVVLTSKQGISKIKIYKLFYDEKYNEIKSKKSEVASCDFLNIGQSYAIKTHIPELIPHYRIEYITHDFRKIELDIRDNLKNGVVSEMIRPKHTIKSVLYYLFR